MMATINRDLYEDEVIEILSSIPVKSLLRFKCVCKSWYSLIEETGFNSKHIKKVKSRLIVIYMEEVDVTDEAYYPQDLFCISPDEKLADLSLEDLEPQKPVFGLLGGPYDGIYCIFGVTGRITLWNLATKDSRLLPKYRAIRPRNTRVSKITVGFGLDPKRNSYKLVLIHTFWDERRSDFHEFSLCTT